MLEFQTSGFWLLQYPTLVVGNVNSIEFKTWGLQHAATGYVSGIAVAAGVQACGSRCPAKYSQSKTPQCVQELLVTSTESQPSEDTYSPALGSIRQEVSGEWASSCSKVGLGMVCIDTMQGCVCWNKKKLLEENSYLNRWHHMVQVARFKSTPQNETGNELHCDDTMVQLYSVDSNSTFTQSRQSVGKEEQLACLGFAELRQKFENNIPFKWESAGISRPNATYSLVGSFSRAGGSGAHPVNPTDQWVSMTVGGFHPTKPTHLDSLSSASPPTVPSALVDHLAVYPQAAVHRLVLRNAVADENGTVHPILLPNIKGGSWVCGKADEYSPVPNMPQCLATCDKFTHIVDDREGSKFSTTRSWFTFWSYPASVSPAPGGNANDLPIIFTGPELKCVDPWEEYEHEHSDWRRSEYGPARYDSLVEKISIEFIASGLRLALFSAAERTQLEEIDILEEVIANLAIPPFYRSRIRRLIRIHLTNNEEPWPEHLGVAFSMKNGEVVLAGEVEASEAGDIDGRPSSCNAYEELRQGRRLEHPSIRMEYLQQAISDREMACARAADEAYEAVRHAFPMLNVTSAAGTRTIPFPSTRPDSIHSWVQVAKDANTAVNWQLSASIQAMEQACSHRQAIKTLPSTRLRNELKTKMDRLLSGQGAAASNQSTAKVLIEFNFDTQDTVPLPSSLSQRVLATSLMRNIGAINFSGQGSVFGTFVPMFSPHQVRIQVRQSCRLVGQHTQQLEWYVGSTLDGQAYLWGANSTSSKHCRDSSLFDATQVFWGTALTTCVLGMLWTAVASCSLVGVLSQGPDAAAGLKKFSSRLKQNHGKGITARNAGCAFAILTLSPASILTLSILDVALLLAISAVSQPYEGMRAMSVAGPCIAFVWVLGMAVLLLRFCPVDIGPETVIGAIGVPIGRITKFMQDNTRNDEQLN